jgi:hypothetical protein
MYDGVKFLPPLDLELSTGPDVPAADLTPSPGLAPKIPLAFLEFPGAELEGELAASYILAKVNAFLTVVG